MKIAVIGTGYVGSVTGICFAYKGYQVMGVDIDAAKVERLQKGQITIYEPELDNLLAQCLKNNKISFTTDLEQAVDFADIIFLALPTPPTEDGSADLKYVLQAARQIAEHMKSYKLIVNKSTVPVDTAQKVANLIASITKQPFDVASNPEFLREGAAVEDFMQPDRVVIGTDTSKAANLLKTLYAPFVKNAETDILCMDIRSAELTKYAANAYLATRISFMNEMANLCLIVGANIDWVRLGIGMDTRIGPKFLFPGIGYGGSCFPKDVLALSETANQNNYNFRILEAVKKANAA
ncbi:MAG TPA: UDP-glucose/GDP-mannose dehydrogenase family protein, partial [Chitinophagales bacterium]|nr:UDP-glucose/GDP-mannose dehydrogenase family protein [Chitinophagales bacterium]